MTAGKYSTTIERFLATPENRRVYEQERLIVDVTELLASAMEAQDLSRAQLAQKLGRSKAFVTQLLRGTQNMTLRTIADVFSALNYRLVLHAMPTDRTISVPECYVGERWIWGGEEYGARSTAQPEPTWLRNIHAQASQQAAEMDWEEVAA